MNGNRTIVSSLAAGMVAFSAAAECMCEDEMEVSSYVQRTDVVQPVDLRTVFPVERTMGDLVLTNLAYSAIGWEREAAADATRTVTITAQAGTLAGGVFTSDGTAAITVMAATTGRGTFDWTVTDLPTNVDQVYQFRHTVSQSGSVDAAAALAGCHYLKFGEEGEWNEAQRACRAQGEVVRRTDFRPSPKRILRREWVLPFEYSATNWTGLAGTTFASEAKVEVVELTGPATTSVEAWTTERAGTRKDLATKVDEGNVVWKTRRGVWKATHTIKTGNVTNATESAILDLRETKSGMRFLME